MRSTLNSLPLEVRTKVAKRLDEDLATLIDLQLQVKQAHWNIRGSDFLPVHELFDALSAAVYNMADLVAERAGQIGSLVEGTADVVAKRSKLAKYSTTETAERDHLRDIANAVAKAGGECRDAIDFADKAGDKVSADVMTDVARQLDVWLWKIESHLH